MEWKHGYYLLFTPLLGEVNRPPLGLPSPWRNSVGCVLAGNFPRVQFRTSTSVNHRDLRFSCPGKWMEPTMHVKTFSRGSFCLFICLFLLCAIIKSVGVWVFSSLPYRWSDTLAPPLTGSSALHVLGCWERGRVVWEGGDHMAWLILTALSQPSPKPVSRNEEEFTWQPHCRQQPSAPRAGLMDATFCGPRHPFFFWRM